MGCVLWVQYCGPHAPRHASENGGQNSDTNPSAMFAKVPNNPELQPYLDRWLIEWEEFWGPPHDRCAEYECTDNGGERQSQTSPSNMPIEMDGAKYDTGRDLNNTSKAKWTIPDVIIDPVLRGDSQQPPDFPPHASPALSSTSTMKSRELPSLPSLKSSGLLDVAAEEVGGRSGSTTPARSVGSWSAAGSTSPRPPYSPNLPTYVGPGSTGSSPARSPLMPQGNMALTQPSSLPQTQYQLSPQGMPSMTPSHGHTTLHRPGTLPVPPINIGSTHSHRTDTPNHAPAFSEQVRR